MLSMLEEVVLLAVDEKTGRLHTSPGYGAGYALAGALFFDLVLAKKIDTDTNEVHLIDTTPAGAPVLDQVLADMAQHPEVKTVRAWIEALQRYGEILEESALKTLVESGILRHETGKRLWVVDFERYPVAEGKPQRDVKQRLAQAILSDAIPDSRDIMLVSIAEACDLLRLVLSREELERRRERIQTLCGLETISRAVAAAIYDLNKLISSQYPHWF